MMLCKDGWTGQPHHHLPQPQTGPGRRRCKAAPGDTTAAVMASGSSSLRSTKGGGGGASPSPKIRSVTSASQHAQTQPPCCKNTEVFSPVMCYFQPRTSLNPSALGGESGGTKVWLDAPLRLSVSPRLGTKGVSLGAAQARPCG